MRYVDVDSWPVIDLFSGCGGMSYGFAARRPFRVLASADAEIAKPCQGQGALGCNATYQANIGIAPLAVDLLETTPDEFMARLPATVRGELVKGLVALLCCPPCTDFSRAKPTNHLADSAKNSLVSRCADFAEYFRPEFVFMENARELMMGRNNHHYKSFCSRLQALGYHVAGRVYKLTSFGLPQVRERAIVVASRDVPVKTLDDLWYGWKLSPEAITVRRAIAGFAQPVIQAGEQNAEDPVHRAPGFASETSRRRIAAIPPDGGSWYDLAARPKGRDLLTASMRQRVRVNDLGSHPDVYGRMSWEKPAPTIKRECAHIGNGRYAHPEQDRLVTAREMATLQGFPRTYDFRGGSLANIYRHIGDAVPPLISFQLSALGVWMKTGAKPAPAEWILPNTHLVQDDVRWDNPLPYAELVRETRPARNRRIASARALR